MEKRLTTSFKENTNFLAEKLTNLYTGSLHGVEDEDELPTTGNVSKPVLEEGYDVVVIGGGPSGVSGALQAALMGNSCLIVDKPKADPDSRGVDASFGGPTGLYSKALRDAAKRLDVTALKAQGLDDDVIWKQVTNECAKLANRNAEGVINSLKKYAVHYQQGIAKLTKGSEDGSIAVEVTRKDGDGEETVTVPAGNVLLATGSKAFRIPGIPFDGIRVHDSDTINGLSFLPKKICIVGAGIIGIEYARIFRKLGSEVYLIAMEDTVCQALARVGMDNDIVRELCDSLHREGIHVYTSTVVTGFRNVPHYLEEPLEITIADAKDKTKPVHGGVLEVCAYIIAIGRRALLNTDYSSRDEALGLKEMGIETDRMGISVNKKTFQTTHPRVFATGDVIGPPSLAATGAEQAKIAVTHMLDPKKAKSNAHSDFDFPVGVWTMPEIGYFGHTKEKAIEEGYDVEEGIASYSNCLRGRVFSPEGILKLVFEKHSGVVLGVHIIGDDACELVHYGMSLIERHVSIFDLVNEVFTAVTYHELFKEAALDGDAKLDFGAAWQGIFNVIKEANVNKGKMPKTEDLREVFETIDTSHRGCLKYKDLDALFNKVGIHVTRNCIERLIKVADLDNSGGIDFEEFKKVFKGMAAMKPRPGDKHRRLRTNVSHHLDSLKRGSLTQSERQALETKS